MKNVMKLLTSVLLAAVSQSVMAECKPIATPASCVLNPSYPSLHANCIRMLSTRVSLGGFSTLANGDYLLAGGKEYITDRKVIASKRAFIYKQASNSLCETSPMISGRSQGYAQILLDDGKVLVPGGYTVYDNIAAAEEFDPASETWSAVGSLPVKLEYYKVERLSDGSPSISGGSIAIRKKGTNVIYEPNLETFVYDQQSKSFTAR